VAILSPHINPLVALDEAIAREVGWIGITEQAERAGQNLRLLRVIVVKTKATGVVMKKWGKWWVQVEQ
jgi:hypothetical protein